MSGLKTYLLPMLALLIAFVLDYRGTDGCDDTITLESANQAIDQHLATEIATLLQPEVLNRLHKEKYSPADYNYVQTLLEDLKDKKIFVELYQQGELILWTDKRQGEGFCKTVEYASYSGDVCYAPFDDRGHFISAELDRLELDHQLQVDHTSGTLLSAGLPLVVGKHYKSPSFHKLILNIYLIGFLSILLLSLKYDEILPWIGLVGLRLLSRKTNWSAHFNLETLTQPILSSSYNTIDLLSDGILVFGGLIFLSNRLFKENTPIPQVGLWGLSSLHMLLFIAHIRGVQLFSSSDYLNQNLEDLSQLSLPDFSFFCVALLTLLGVFHFGYTLLKHHRRVYADKQKVYLTYGLSILLAIGLSHLLHLDVNNLVLGFFLVLYLTLIDLYVDEKTKTVTWVICWGIFFAMYLAALLFNYDFNQEVKNRKVALQQAYHNIPTKKIAALKANHTLPEAGSMISDLLILPEGAYYDRAEVVSVVSESMGRDDLSLEIYDNKGKSLFDKSKYSLSYFSNLVQLDSLSYFDELQAIAWFEVPVEGAKAYAGFSFDEKYQVPLYPYNYYRNGQLVYKNQNLSQEEYRLASNSTSSVITRGSDILVTYKPSSSRLLVSKKAFPGFIKPVALFAFLFSILIGLVIVMALMRKHLKVLPEDWSLVVQNMHSLNSKIQISLILVIFLSFLVIATITSTYLKAHLHKEKQLVIKEKLENLTQSFVDKTRISTTLTESVEIVSNYEKDIEKIHNVALEVYPLYASRTGMDFFTKMYFTKQDNPGPITYKMNEAAEHSLLPIMHKEEIAGVATISLNRKTEGHALSVLDFLGSIFNVYVFLFLIASVLSIFIAQSITKPLSILNQNMSMVGLGKENEKIDWAGDDEIGVLINNYNTMVAKLEESAEMLAKKERDNAWREMAKQVAHEIKNPLTPMKLSIQYLEKAIKRNPAEAHQITKKLSTTMLEQIENLTGIAEAFGNFAKMPQTANSTVELNSVVEAVHNLFRKREDMNINLAVPIDPVYVFADKNQIIRILNNLVKNATESIPDSRKGEIFVTLTTKANKAIIEVKDNGIGITEDQRDKIFQPKFTTKDSGSGLGLAISANVMESMNGRIYFDSTPGLSTSFYMELDLIRSQVYHDSKERITLD